MVQMRSCGPSCLLQELVLALAGHTGEVFVRKGSEADDTGLKIMDPCTRDVQIADDLSWVAPAERCFSLPSSPLRLCSMHCQMHAAAQGTDE